MRRLVREHSLAPAFFTIFFAALIAQALFGHSPFNHDQIAHHAAMPSLSRFVT